MMEDVATPRRIVAVIAGSVIAVTLGAGGVRALTPADNGDLRLSTVPQGVSAHDVGGRPVFLVRRGNQITGFLRTSTRRLTNLVWCPADDVFQAPAWGETFDSRGRLIRDYSPRDMDRVRVVVHHTAVTVYATAVTRAPTLPTDSWTAHKRAAFTDWFNTHPGRQPLTDYCSPTVP
jgi:hypothetical protein